MNIQIKTHFSLNKTLRYNFVNKFIFKKMSIDYKRFNVKNMTLMGVEP